MSEHMPAVLIGVGNRFRRDDAAGLEVARRLREAGLPGFGVLESDGDPASLLEAWSGAAEAVVVDAGSSGAPAGALHRFDATNEPIPVEVLRASTHAMGIAEAVELGRALGRLPGRLTVYGIEGEAFEMGEGLTDAVELAVEQLVAQLQELLTGQGVGR